MLFNKLFKRKINLHFLHIGKTGGSNIKSTLQDVKTESYNFIFHSHKIRLEDIPIGDKYFFCTRDPIDRFQSGFYSRKRKGQPRYYYEWSGDEAKSFSFFSNPNELAEMLHESNENYENAKFAMESIIHVNSSYWDWFRDREYFKERVDDLFFILRLENLESDFKKFIQKVNGEHEIELGTDSLSKHSNNIEYFLSEKSFKNLMEWYNEEYKFLKFIDDLSKKFKHIPPNR